MLNKKYNLVSLILICLFGFMATANAESAQPKLYKIEVVVFEHITQKSLASEAWPTTVQEPNLSGAIQLKPTEGDEIQPYELLPAKDLDLDSEVKKLNNNRSYKVLTHIAWVQPVNAPRFAKPVQITGGTEYTADGQIMLPEPGGTHLSSGDYQQLNGTITVSVMKYLQIQTDLLLTEPGYKIPQQANAQGETASLISFPMQQTRRTKSKDLNYFDHPLFGMLIEITPVSSESSASTS